MKMSWIHLNFEIMHVMSTRHTFNA